MRNCARKLGVWDGQVKNPLLEDQLGVVESYWVL